MIGFRGLGDTVYLNDARYGIYSQSTDLNSRGFYFKAPDRLFLIYKLTDKEGALIAYGKQTVQGVNAWVPKGVRVVPWDTNTEFESFLTNLATGLAYMAAFYALAPAIGYGLAFASVGMFGDAAIALLPVGEKYAKQYAAEYLSNYFD
jgi:hypothetical protein